MPFRTLSGFLALAVIAALADPAAAATLDVGRGKKYATIAEAVAAAAPGDRVVISRGRYLESVAVATPRVQIVAKPGVVWLPGTVNTACLTFQAAAEDSSVTGVTFRGRGDGVVVEAPRVTVQKCTFRASSSGVRSTSDGTKVLRSKFHLCWTAVEVRGDDAVVDQLVVNHTSSNCVGIDGDGAVVTRVVARGSADDNAIDIYGNRARVEDCKAFATWNSCVYVHGDDAVVRRCTALDILSDTGFSIYGNRALVEGCTSDGCARYGVFVSGADARVIGNRISNCADDGVRIDGASFEVRGNRVVDLADGSGVFATDNTGSATKASVIADNDLRNCSSNGIEIYGDGIRVTGNTVRDALQRGIQIYGSNHVIEDDDVTTVGYHGIDVEGTGVVVRRCRVTDAGQDGVRVGATGAVIESCVITDAALDGLDVRAESATFRSCRITGNRQDVAATGTGFLTDDGGNVFDTGGTGTQPLELW